MIKYIIGAVFLGSLVFPSVSFAASQQELNTAYITALQQVIALLTQEVQMLEAQLADINKQVAISPSTPIPVVIPSIIINSNPLVPTPVQVVPVAGAPAPSVSLVVNLSSTTPQAQTGEARFSVSVYDKNGVLTKIPVDVTTNDPDLPTQFGINAPGQVGWFCVAPSYVDFPNHGCPNVNPVSVGTFTFDFKVEGYEVDTEKTITVVP